MLRHCSRRLRFSVGNDMAREVYAKLDARWRFNAMTSCASASRASCSAVEGVLAATRSVRATLCHHASFMSVACHPGKAICVDLTQYAETTTMGRRLASLRQ